MNPEIKECPKCGRQFACNNYNILKCDCIHIPLDREAREKLARDFDDCLCIDCLKEYSKPVADLS